MRDAPERSDQVDLDGKLELLDRIELRGLRLLVARDRLRRIRDAGAVDEDSFLPMRCASLGEGGRHLLVAGHIDFAEDSADFGRDSLTLLLIAVEYGDFRP